MKKRFLAILLTVCMVISMVPVAMAAPAYGDTDGHWAESSINRWSGYGIVQGADGMFDPNGQLTCAQLATILVNLLKLPAAPSAGFTDNPDGSWFADAINRCAAAGILLGNGDGTVAPTQSISRDRTMVMLARALGVEPVAKPDLSNYSDAAKVAPYAAGYVAALVDAGVVNGLTETELAPQEEINRASTVTILDKAISTYADKDGATVNVTDGKGITLIVADNVTVKGTVETLVVASSDANVKLDGVTAEKVAVTGEGNKVELANSKVETVVASGEKSAVATSGKTTVETVSIAAADASMSVGKGSTVETLTVTEAAANAEVKVASGASVQALETAAEKTTVDNSGVIATATIAESATGTEVKANSGSYTGTVKTEAADTTVGGTGAVAKVEASGSAASGEGAANVTTQGTTTEKTDASGATSTDTNTGKLPATDSANSEAAKDAAAGTGNDTPTTAPSTPSGGGSYHSHSYDSTTHKCACGTFDPAVVATIGNEYGYLTLQDALNAGGEVTLVADVDVAKTLTVEKTVTLNMNSKKLFNTEEIWNEGTGAWSLVSVRGAGDLTVTGNGTFAAKANDCYAIDLYSESSKCTIENGSYLGNIAAVYVYRGQLTVNGGTFNIQQVDNSSKPYGFVLNCYDAHYKAGTAKITVTGGSFCKYDPSSSKSENPDAKFVPVGYDALPTVQNGDTWYMIVKGTVVSDATELNTALADANIDTVYLANDISLTAPVEIKRSVTIIGADDGKSLTITSSDSQRVVNINDNTNDITLTMKNVKVVGPTSGSYTRGISAYNNSGALNIVLDNCSVSCNYYALNIGGENKTVDVNVTNSTLTGWCAIQSHSDGAKVNVSKSTLIGKNDKTYNAEGWNDFATLVINSGVSGNVWNITDTTIRATATNHDGKYNGQILIDIRNEGNTVTLDSGCSLDLGQNRFAYKFAVTGASRLVVGDKVYQGYKLTGESVVGTFEFAYDDKEETLTVTCKDIGNADTYRYLFLELHGDNNDPDIEWLNDFPANTTSMTELEKKTNHLAYVVDIYQMSADGETQFYIGSLKCE